MTLGFSIALAACAFVVALVAIPAFKRLAARYRLVDVAGDDPLKIHTAPVPFVGGLGIGLGSFLALSVAAASVPGLGAPLALVLGIGAVVAALGFTDDVSSVSPTVRLGVELLAGAAFGAGALALALLDPGGLPLGGASGPVALVLFALFYVVGAINAVNMQDGLDGLAGGIVLISCAGFAALAAARGDGLSLAIALGLGGAVAAFLIYNFHPASVFMGDNGSYFLGFLVAAMALVATLQKGSVAGLVGGVLVVGVPVFDAGFAIVRRVRRGVSPFAGDRSHFYDYLSQAGYSTPVVAFVSYAIQVLFVSIGCFILL